MLESPAARSPLCVSATAARRCAASFRSSAVGKGSDRQVDSRSSGLRHVFGAAPRHQRNLPARGRREPAPRPAARFRQANNGRWLIAALVLFLVAGGGFIWWQQHQVANGRAGRSSSLPTVYKRHRQPATLAKAPSSSTSCRDSGSKAVRASALFARAALALQQNDTKRRPRPIAAIAADSSLPAALSRRRADPPDRARVRPAEAAGRDHPPRSRSPSPASRGSAAPAR